ncbi:hypothetical protein E2C01_027734 [Portunus trituberculatus]|uniref:Uncharacterized protein n=1 Tax=Portunus trituberculatus TaxID=210409 RepID=A0A5B7EMF6_PORTR|nr:hypothetical protein [Portunus trituberculatus]
MFWAMQMGSHRALHKNSRMLVELSVAQGLNYLLRWGPPNHNPVSVSYPISPIPPKDPPKAEVPLAFRLPQLSGS